jgi:hypothetical protein
MKRDFSRLTQKHIDGIKQWLLKSDKNNSCPFYGWYPTCRICHDLFPNGPDRVLCPCDQYSTKYIAKVARQVIKQWESNLSPSPGTGESSPDGDTEV